MGPAVHAAIDGQATTPAGVTWNIEARGMKGPIDKFHDIFYSSRNRKAARKILDNIAGHGGESAQPVQWARHVIAVTKGCGGPSSVRHVGRHPIWGELGNQAVIETGPRGCLVMVMETTCSRCARYGPLHHRPQSGFQIVCELCCRCTGGPGPGTK